MLILMVDFLGTYAGQAAGLATSVLWTFTSIFFTSASKRLGATILNSYRIFVAVLLLTLTHRVLQHYWIPQALPRQFLFLALSGVIGLSIGDLALFRAFIDIGPRRSMLVMTTAPIFAALFGWMALGETLPPFAWIGIALVISGVSWVILERPKRATDDSPGLLWRGTLLAFFAAACQAAGLLFSKQGMGHGWAAKEQYIQPETATLIRMFFAALGTMPILALYIWRQSMRPSPSYLTPRAGSRKTGFLYGTAGACVGPYLGVWMSLVASDRAPLGIAQTLCSLTPIFILPFVATIYKEQITMRAFFGAVVAVAGVALLFLIH